MLQRFGVALLISLSVIQCGRADAETGLRIGAIAATRPNNEYAATHQSRKLSAFSWWYSLLNHLGIHPPCHPPGPHRHRNCNHSSNGGNGGSSGGSSSSASYYNDGSSSSSSSSYNNGNGGSSSNYGNGGSTASSSNNDDGVNGYYDNQYTDDENLYFTHEDDWSQSSNNNYLENGRPSTGGAGTVGGLNASNVAPFIAGALVATLVGIAFMAAKRRQTQRNDDNNDDESSVVSGFVEISNIRHDEGVYNSP